jgi:hypothetical protein
MGRTIIKLADRYLEWSSIVDAPATYGMTLEEFKNYYEQSYGTSSMAELEERLKRVEKTGTSSMSEETVDELISFNRAGFEESCLSKEELIDHYVIIPEQFSVKLGKKLSLSKDLENLKK